MLLWYSYVRCLGRLGLLYWSSRLISVTFSDLLMIFCLILLCLLSSVFKRQTALPSSWFSRLNEIPVPEIDHIVCSSPIMNPFFSLIGFCSMFLRRSGILFECELTMHLAMSSCSFASFVASKMFFSCNSIARTSHDKF